MSKSWWEIPSLDIVEWSPAVSALFNRLLAQIYFFQLKSLLHLPFLPRAVGDSRYEYSRFTCLNTSREVIFRHLAFRKARNMHLKCPVLDFSAFLIAIILILDQLGSRSSEIETPQDNQWKVRIDRYIKEVISSLKTVSCSGREPVARQSVEVLKNLLALNTTSRSLRLTISYSGIITCHSRISFGSTEQLRIPNTIHTQHTTTTTTWRCI
jgi:hypothetical protein